MTPSFFQILCCSTVNEDLQYCALGDWGQAHTICLLAIGKRERARERERERFGSAMPGRYRVRSVFHESEGGLPLDSLALKNTNTLYFFFFLKNI